MTVDFEHGMRTEYTHEDGEEILKRAIAIETHETSAREMVRRTAAEMGVSQEALTIAEEAHFAEKQERVARRQFAAKQKRSFISSLITYIAVNGVLIFIDGISDGRLGWSVYPLAAWGIWMVFHAIETLFVRGEDYEKRFEKWRNRRNDKDDDDDD
ncbi:MAG: 2TM domain-containing protein [Fimbriimonadales bacterium]